MLVKYSKKELTIKQTIIRALMHLILLEAIILASLYLVGLLTSLSMAVSLGVSILLIDLTVNLVLWIQDSRTAKQFNEALVKLQKEYSVEEQG